MHKALSSILSYSATRTKINTSCGGGASCRPVTAFGKEAEGKGIGKAGNKLYFPAGPSLWPGNSLQHSCVAFCHLFLEHASLTLDCNSFRRKGTAPSIRVGRNSRPGSLRRAGTHLLRLKTPRKFDLRRLELGSEHDLFLQCAHWVSALKFTHVWESWSNLNTGVFHWPLHQKVQDYIKALSKKRTPYGTPLKHKWDAQHHGKVHGNFQYTSQMWACWKRLRSESDHDQLLLKVKLTCRSDFFFFWKLNYGASKFHMSTSQIFILSARF